MISILVFFGGRHVCQLANAIRREYTLVIHYYVFISITMKQVTGVHLALYIIKTSVVAVGDDGLTL